jgi:hypothetical protein
MAEAKIQERLLVITGKNSSRFSIRLDSIIGVEASRSKDWDSQDLKWLYEIEVILEGGHSKSISVESEEEMNQIYDQISQIIA